MTKQATNVTSKTDIAAITATKSPTPPRATSNRTATRSHSRTTTKTKRLAKAIPSQKASNSKSDVILALLKRKTGASIAELQDATDWQAHSVRGFLSGTVKKKHSLSLCSARTAKGERRYSIAKL